MVEPTEELSRIGPALPASIKQVEETIKVVFAAIPGVTKKELEISKTPSAEVSQLTSVKTSPQEVAMIERKITARALKKGRANVESKLKAEGKSSSESSDMEKIRKRIFGG